jgi:hypothetical protein
MRWQQARARYDRRPAAHYRMARNLAGGEVLLLVLISALALSLGSAWIRVSGGDADDAARSTARVGGKSQT